MKKITLAAFAVCAFMACSNENKTVSVNHETNKRDSTIAKNTAPKQKTMEELSDSIGEALNVSFTPKRIQVSKIEEDYRDKNTREVITDKNSANLDHLWKTTFVFIDSSDEKHYLELFTTVDKDGEPLDDFQLSLKEIKEVYNKIINTPLEEFDIECKFYQDGGMGGIAESVIVRRNGRETGKKIGNAYVLNNPVQEFIYAE